MADQYSTLGYGNEKMGEGIGTTPEERSKNIENVKGGAKSFWQLLEAGMPVSGEGYYEEKPNIQEASMGDNAALIGQATIPAALSAIAYKKSPILARILGPVVSGGIEAARTGGDIPSAALAAGTYALGGGIGEKMASKDALALETAQAKKILDAIGVPHESLKTEIGKPKVDKSDLKFSLKPGENKTFVRPPETIAKEGIGASIREGLGALDIPEQARRPNALQEAMEPVKLKETSVDRAAKTYKEVPKIFLESVAETYGEKVFDDPAKMKTIIANELAKTLHEKKINTSQAATEFIGKPLDPSMVNVEHPGSAIVGLKDPKSGSYYKLPLKDQGERGKALYEHLQNAKNELKEVSGTVPDTEIIAASMPRYSVRGEIPAVYPMNDETRTLLKLRSNLRSILSRVEASDPKVAARASTELQEFIESPSLMRRLQDSSRDRSKSGEDIVTYDEKQYGLGDIRKQLLDIIGYGEYGGLKDIYLQKKYIDPRERFAHETLSKYPETIIQKGSTSAPEVKPIPSPEQLKNAAFYTGTGTGAIGSTLLSKLLEKKEEKYHGK